MLTTFFAALLLMSSPSTNHHTLAGPQSNNLYKIEDVFPESIPRYSVRDWESKLDHPSPICLVIEIRPDGSVSGKTRPCSDR